MVVPPGADGAAAGATAAGVWTGPVVSTLPVVSTAATRGAPHNSRTTGATAPRSPSWNSVWNIGPLLFGFGSAARAAICGAAPAAFGASVTVALSTGVTA